jgi:hypothetical protein
MSLVEQPARDPKDRLVGHLLASTATMASAEQRVDEGLSHATGRHRMLSQPERLFDLKPTARAQAVDRVLWREAGVRVAAGGHHEDLESGIGGQRTTDVRRDVVASAEVELPTDNHVHGLVAPWCGSHVKAMEGHRDLMGAFQECAKSWKRLLTEVVASDVQTTELPRAPASTDP